MGVLSRYLLARFLLTFVATLLLMVLAAAIVELIGDIGDVMKESEGLLGALLYVGLRIPSVHLPLLIPVAAFVAAFLAFGTAARASEFVAIKAGGVSPLRVLVPAFVAAAVISALGLVAHETLAVRANEALRRHVRGGDPITFRRGSFWYHKGRYVYNVRDADPGARELREVAIFELDGKGRLVRSIQAARARIGVDGRWDLGDAVIRGFDPERPAAPISYEQVARTELALDEELALFDAGVEDLSIRELREYRDGRPPGDSEAVRADALLHARLTAPLSTFVFVLLATPLGLRVEQSRGLARPALFGLLAVFAFSTLQEYGSALAAQGVTAPALPSWTVLALFALASLALLLRTPR
jgi:lipopolysaccharide export system permease protein